MAKRKSDPYPPETGYMKVKWRAGGSFRPHEVIGDTSGVPLKMRQNQPELLQNVTCCYCRTSLTDVPSNKEHVIGKNFVPKGSLQKSWNLIAQACVSCNTRKSDLEDDMALLSLQHYPFDGTDPESDAAVRGCFEKASRTYSRHAKKPVSKSTEETTLETALGPGGSFSVGMIAPPQVNDDRAFALAHMQATAFYYLLTYRYEERRGVLWPGGGFFTADVATRSDWGNPIQRWLMDTVRRWHVRLVVTAARNFFKVAIRKNPDLPVWSCALEWNEGIRVIALFGEKESALAIGRGMPRLFTEEHVILRTPEKVTSYRTEVPLKAEDDRMFSFE